jgi:hypothetical protein
MLAKLERENYECPLGIIEEHGEYNELVILGNCGMCRFGDKSQGPCLRDICQAPEGMTLARSEQLVAEFEKKLGKRINLNDITDRRAYWVFVRAKISK